MFNLVVVLVFTLSFALLLIYFISAHDKKFKNQNDPKTPSSAEIANDFKLFAKFAVDLCEYLKLEVKDFSQHPPYELSIRAENVNPITRVEYLVLGIFTTRNDVIDANTLTAFSDQIVSERISKGILISPSTISEHFKNLPELAPIDFVDGAKYLELKNKIIL